VAGTAIFILLRVDHVQCHVTPPHSSLPEKVLVPSTRQNNQNNKNNSVYMPYCVDKSLLIVCEPTSKPCPRDPSSPKTHFSSYLAKNTLLRPIQNPYIARYTALALMERLSHWHSLTSSYRPYKHLLASSYRL
jgi:hypothetical protein